jgi:hypothetical protein
MRMQPQSPALDSETPSPPLDLRLDSSLPRTVKPPVQCAATRNDITVDAILWRAELRRSNELRSSRRLHVVANWLSTIVEHGASTGITRRDFQPPSIGQRKTLRACSLVGRSWVYPARDSSFPPSRSISISIPRGRKRSPPRTPGFSATSVRSVTSHGTASIFLLPSMPSPTTCPHFISFEPYPFPACVSIRTSPSRARFSQRSNTPSRLWSSARSFSPVVRVRHARRLLPQPQISRDLRSLIMMRTTNSQHLFPDLFMGSLISPFSCRMPSQPSPMGCLDRQWPMMTLGSASAPSPVHPPYTTNKSSTNVGRA